MGQEPYLIKKELRTRIQRPDMMSYCNLPESEKFYDGEIAMQTLTCKEAWGEIKRR